MQPNQESRSPKGVAFRRGDLAFPLAHPLKGMATEEAMTTKRVLSLRGRRLFALIAFLALPTVALGAQPGTQSLAAARSREIQSQLQRIDADRAGFVDDFLAQWAPLVDDSMYDVRRELGPMAMVAPAWQLYGASLAGDFQTMMRVLRGAEGPGKYVNAFMEGRTEARVKLATGGRTPQIIGDSDTSLVYVPIAPCRVVDTRNAGTRTGILTAGTSRTFDLTTEAFTDGQGGTGPCPGLPNYSYYGWSVNITAAGYAINGNLVVWGYGGTEPATSILNHPLGPYAIANAATVTGCVGCTDDIVVKANVGDTHVIIDVMGYYKDASVADSTVTRWAGTPMVIPANSKNFVTGGACPTGTVMIGGEVDHSAGDVAMGESHQDSSVTWTFWMINNTASSVSITAWSRCLDLPVRRY